jgi:hypothetical protein
MFLTRHFVPNFIFFLAKKVSRKGVNLITSSILNQKTT